MVTQLQDAGVGQELDAAAAGIGRPHQEIAVAADEAKPRAGARAGRQRVRHLVAQRTRRVVTDPGLEQVAKDVQGLGLLGLIAQEAQEQLGDLWACRVEMQI